MTTEETPKRARPTVAGMRELEELRAAREPRPQHRGRTVKRFAGLVLAALVLAGCGASNDGEQTDLITVDGEVDCVVVRNRANRITFVDCDWGER